MHHNHNAIQRQIGDIFLIFSLKIGQFMQTGSFEDGFNEMSNTIFWRKNKKKLSAEIFSRDVKHIKT